MVKKRRWILVALAVLVVGVSPMVVQANSENNPHSIEIQGKINQDGWLEEGKYYAFDGKDDYIQGKFALNDKEYGKIQFDFYDEAGNLVATRSKVVQDNPSELDYFGYTFDLDAAPGKGKYKVKGSVDGHLGMSWLNY